MYPGRCCGLLGRRRRPSAVLPSSLVYGDLAGLRGERGRPGVAVPDRLPRQHVQDHRRDRWVRAGLQDERLFAEQVVRDDFRDVPADQLLMGLRESMCAGLRRELRAGWRWSSEPSLRRSARPRGPGTTTPPPGGLRARSGDPDLCYYCWGQLAGARDAAVRAVDRQPAAIPLPDGERPADPH